MTDDPTPPPAPPEPEAPAPAPEEPLEHRARRFLSTTTGRVVAAGVVVVLLVGLWLVWPYLASGGDIRAGLEHQPSRLWGAPTMVASGDAFDAGSLAARLDELGYRRVEAPVSVTDEGEEGEDGEEADGKDESEDREPRPKTYSVDSQGLLAIHLPHRVAPDGRFGRETVTVSFASAGNGAEGAEGAENAGSPGPAVAEILDEDGDPVPDGVFLGAPLLASYYGDEVKEIEPVELDELPDHVIYAVLAAEDRRFLTHLGVSPEGIARAAVVNAQEGGVEQGGSTITQQLVKNIWLSHERSLIRKGREAVLALLVDLGHSKRDILQAYLNQIYLGTGDGLNYHGVGAAARHVFGKDVRDLSVSEAAILAGMIRSPGNNSPIAHPEAAAERREHVLATMLEMEAIDQATHDAALAEPVEGAGRSLRLRRAPYFADAMRDEAERRFGIGRLGDRGYHLFTTLDLDEQAAAEQAVESTLRRLPARSRLQGALVTVDPRDGRILAWVGGRDYEESQFDRVRSAKRQAGSAFKPVVLAAALASGDYTPSSRLDDSPLTVDMDGRAWEPQNSDRSFRGPVTLRRTMEESLNVPTVRLAQAVGLGRVADTARELGIRSEMEELPSIALGAFEVSPLELASVYATFASGGVRPDLHGLAAVTDARGGSVAGGGSEGEEVLDPKVASQVTSILRGVVVSGTGRSAQNYSVAGSVAGKTGTSNEARDNWFAAYRPDRVTVVWVGHDEPQPTPLSGARAALPVWGSYARAGYPKTAPPPEALPEGVETVIVCRESGLQPLAGCPVRIEETFVTGTAPTDSCDIHVPGWNTPAEPESDGNWLENALRSVFG
jgi:penicillin-binding protein 1B